MSTTESPITSEIKQQDPFLNERADTTSHLHMSDVECRGETIYFAVVDRFNTGKKDQLGKETPLDDPMHNNWLKYWGGDLQGIVDKLDYLHDPRSDGSLGNASFRASRWRGG